MMGGIAKAGDPVWVLSIGRCACVLVAGVEVLTVDYGRGKVEMRTAFDCLPLDRAPIGEHLYMGPPPSRTPTA